MSDGKDLYGWMTHAEWSAAHAAKRQKPATDEPVIAKATVYHGTSFRSVLEANWACTLDYYAIEWQYEQWLYHPASGEKYLPDFYLPVIRTFIEVKGSHMIRVHKPEHLAVGVMTTDVVVLLGFDPAYARHSPYSSVLKLKWRDPLGYDTRLARCGQCSCWQWMRAELSRLCRSCGAFHVGYLAKSGEMPFQRADPDWPPWLGGALCRGSGLTIRSIATRRSLRLGMRQSAYLSAVAHTALSI